MELTRSVRVRAGPLTLAEWTALLDEAGFKIRRVIPAPMLLLAPASVVRDEGWKGALALAGRILRQPVAVRRVADLWRTMHRERRHLVGAVAIVAEHPGD